MRLWYLPSLSLLLYLACSLSLSHLPSSHAAVVPPTFTADLDRFIQCVMSSNWTSSPSPPEFTISVVANGDLVMARGYGADANGDPITERTLFGIGSISKAFTSTLMAMLAGQGKMPGPQVPISYYSRLLRTYSPYIDASATFRDLVTHRTGLSRGDLIAIFHEPGADWRDTVRQVLPVLPPLVPFRSQFFYNNWVLSQAGAIVQDAAGIDWEDLMLNMIFLPLGMNDTQTSTTESRKAGLRASPYTAGPLPSDPIIRLPDDVDDTVDLVKPAGSICSSALDMSRWMLFQLNTSPSPVLNATVLRYLHEGQSELPPYSSRFLHGSGPGQYSSVSVGYGYGWFEVGLNGHQLVTHSGGTLGFYSDLLLFPDPADDFGVFVSNPAISGEPMGFISLWVSLTLLGEDNWVDGLCSSSQTVEERADAWSRAQPKVDAVMRDWESRRERPSRIHSYSSSAAPADPFDQSASPAHPEPALAGFAARSDPALLVGTYNSGSAWGSLSITPSGNSSWPLAFSWQAARGLLRPNPYPFSDGYDLVILAPAWAAIMPQFRLSFNSVIFVVFNGTVNGVVVAFDAPVAPYFRAAASPTSSSTGGGPVGSSGAGVGSSSGPVGPSGSGAVGISSSSSGEGGGGGSGSSSSSVLLTVGLCILSVLLLAVIAYAGWITKKYRDLRGGARSPSADMRESLI